MAIFTEYFIMVKFICNCTDYMLVTNLYCTNHMLAILSIFLNPKVGVLYKIGGQTIREEIIKINK